MIITLAYRVLLCVLVWPTFASSWIWIVEFTGATNDWFGISAVLIAASLSTGCVFVELKHWRREPGYDD